MHPSSKSLLPFAAALFAATVFPAKPAAAACTPAPASGVTTTCGNTNLGNTPLGTGSGGPDNSTIIIQSGTSVTAGNSSAISLRDGAVITLQNNASVISNGATGGSNGLWGAGKNTIEFRSGGTLTIGQGASVRATGTATNAEAVNLIGEGNTVINRGTISAINSAAIWFEDTVVGRTNTIDNFGIIRRGSGSGTVTDNTIGNQRDGAVHFINRAGAIVYGGLFFANGNDVLELFPGSVVTGGFDGRGGTNTLTLNGEAGSSDVLAGSISNFQFLTKTGGGTWTLEGTVGNNSGAELAVQVQQGTLVLTGNNTDFNGSVTVDPAGVLQARAQSLPPTITNNGIVHFAQPDNGTYAGVITGSGAVLKTSAGVLTMTGAHSYAGGTTIQGGTIAIDADNRLGNAGGPLVLNGGTLELTASFNLSPSRAITVTVNDGTIQTDAGVSSTISQAITGAGTLTKAGPGQLTLTAANSYAGGTAISGGTLQLGAGGTTGSIAGDVVDNGTLVFNRSDQVQFDGTISGSGSLVQAGSGQTTLTGQNSYTGTTTVSAGYLFVNGDQTAATGATSVASDARLSGIGTIGGSVTVADNAVLAPGAVPFTPGTLTINGNLNLGNNSNVFYNLIQAGVAGGADNDLTVVRGDLVLDGVVNVLDQGQTFAPGVYRIINYTGTLTNNGLTIGSFMNDQLQKTRELTDLSVQTAIPGQVNLINTAGLELNYWDGTGNAGTKNNDIIEGGDGLWREAGPTAAANWTDPNGSLNAPWADGHFAIFTGASGTVTVTNAFGNVTASGISSWSMATRSSAIRSRWCPTLRKVASAA